MLAACRDHAPDSRYWAADLGDLERAEQVVHEAWDAFGAVDCLVNNAGIPKRTPVPRLTPSDVAHVMDVNFHAPVRMTLALLPHWLERGAGCVVNVSSLGGRLPIAHEAAYCASKFALCGWSEAMAVDLHGTGVEVKLMLPGPIDTEIWDQPDNDAAAFSGPFVPAVDCAAAIMTGMEGEGFEYYVPAEFPGRPRHAARNGREQDGRHRRVRHDDGNVRPIQSRWNCVNPEVSGLRLEFDRIDSAVGEALVRAVLAEYVVRYRGTDADAPSPAEFTAADGGAFVIAYVDGVARRLRWPPVPC